MRRALIACALALSACEGPADVAATSEAAGANATGRAWPLVLSLNELPAFFDCLRTNNATVVSAHRGGPRPGLAENSLEAFDATTARASVMLEVDVGRTRDGALVLMHDDTVERTTNGEGAVGSLTLAQFQGLRLRDDTGEVLNAHPPTLRQALDWADRRAILELDVKRGVSYEDVAREVRDSGAMHRVVFITYSIDGAVRLARVAPEAMIYTTITDARDLDTLEQRGVDLSRVVAWLGDDELDRHLLAALNARDVEARWGMFDRQPNFAAAVESGVESIAVNRPEAAYRAIDAADGVDGYAATRCLGAD